MIKVGIVGGTGYTGVELLRLLAQHPQAELAVITSRKEAGTRVADMFPSLRGHVDLVFSETGGAGLNSATSHLRHAAWRRHMTRAACSTRRADHRSRG
jgi:N-acetyl-gamma-glutamylphosphate reductase